MTVARAWFAERPRQELVRLDQLEIIRSPLSAPVDHARMAVLSFFAETAGRGPPRARSSGDGLPAAAVGAGADQRRPVGLVQPWMPLTYFQLWMTRLMGLLPDIAHCTACGEALQAADISLQYVSAMASSAPCIATAAPTDSAPIPGNSPSGCCAPPPRLLPPNPGPAAAGKISAVSPYRPSNATSNASSAPPRQLRG